MTVSIESFMSRPVRCLETGTPIRDAYKLMRELEVRHFPILHEGKIAGVLSQRDLLKLESLVAIDRSIDPVSDAMSSPAFVVAPEAPIDEVVQQMADRKIGSAVVVSRGKVVGIFTTTDALQAFAAVLRHAPITPRPPRFEAPVDLG